jgi:hypothetical protein
MSETKKTDGLKWNRAQGGRTSWVDIGPINAMALAGIDAVNVINNGAIKGAGSTLDAAEAAAEAKLRETYDALREHFDPVPVLRWKTYERGRDCIGKVDGNDSVVLETHDGGWVAKVNGIEVDHGGDYASPYDTADFKRAAEAALRALGVPFRVETAR